MNRDLLWVVLALGGTFGAAYLNEKYNLANPQMERQLVGCWAGSTASGKVPSGSFVLQVNADKTFSETAVERLAGDPKFVNASGTWKVQKDNWILEYKKSTASFIVPRAGHSLRLIVLEVTDAAIRAKAGYSVQLPYEMSRVEAQNGECQVSS